MNEERFTGEKTRRRANDGGATRRAFLRGSAGVALAAGLGVDAIGTASAQGIETPRLHREGNLIVDPDGNKVVLRGVNIADPARLNDQDRRYHATAEWVVEQALDESAGWYNRVIRIPCQTGDIGGAGQNELAPGEISRGDVETYLEEHLRPVVDLCGERGAYCIVDYHRHAMSQLEYTDTALDEEVRMFWDVMAPAFADDEHVLFEVYNEPIAPYSGHNNYDPTEGTDVLDPEAKDDWDTWKEAAQPWVDHIRERAPETIIIIGSPRWTQYTYWAAQDEFEGENLAYAGHVYAHENLRPLGEYFGEPSEEVPVFLTEFGFDADADFDYLDGTASEEGEEFVEFFEEYDSVHWQLWCFDPRWSPVMFEEDQGEWTLLGGEYQGQFFKDYLAEKRDDDLPGGDGTGNGDGTDDCADDEIEIAGEYCAADDDGDGRFRDVDGTGTTGSNDVVSFFEHLEGDAIQGNPDAFDFNDSGGVGFDDVVALFQSV